MQQSKAWTSKRMDIKSTAKITKSFFMDAAYLRVHINAMNHNELPERTNYTSLLKFCFWSRRNTQRRHVRCQLNKYTPTRNFFYTRFPLTHVHSNAMVYEIEISTWTHYISTVEILPTVTHKEDVQDVKKISHTPALLHLLM